jgi:hypothetical protein
MALQGEDVSAARTATQRRRVDASPHDGVEGHAPETSPALAAQALAFAVRCHNHQRRDSDGAPFIEHPLEVARLLRDAGCSETVVAAGLLHDVVEDAGVGVRELSARFGPEVGALVGAVTDDANLDGYRRRKQALRDQVRDAGGEAALVFAADKISKVRDWPRQVGRDCFRFDDGPRADRSRRALARHHELRMEHYRESLTMLQQVAPAHPLVTRLGRELDVCMERLANAR